MTTHYAGSDWIKGNIFKGEMSPLGIEIADFLGDMFRGIYHLSPGCLRRVEWSNRSFIVFSLTHRTLSTVDFNELTILVVLAHDRMLRVEISAAAPHNIQLMFHKRTTREGDIYKRCPTIDDHIKIIRSHYEGEG